MLNARSNALDAPMAMQPLVMILSRRILLSILIALICGLAPGLARATDCPDQTLCPLNSISRMPTITIVYDNNPHRVGLATGWGFSCLVQGMQKTVLFDTGGDGRLLLANMKKLGIGPREIDAVVISHLHGDHVEGLQTLLSVNRQITTYLPESFPEPFKEMVKKQGARMVTVQGPVKICADLFSIGELGKTPREQALVVRTRRGLVIVTGCAHPGIERVVRTAKERFGADVLLVLGGFHLTGSSRSEIAAVIAGLKKLGVRHVAPCHCTGGAARKLFKRAYGPGFVDLGVGKVVDTQELR